MRPTRRCATRRPSSAAAGCTTSSPRPSWPAPSARCSAATSDGPALAGSARTRFRRRADDRWRRVAELALLSADLADGRPPGRLVGPAERLAQEFGEQGLQLQARTAELIATTALTRLGKVDAGRATRCEQLPPLSATDPIAVRLQQRAAAATVARADGSSRPGTTAGAHRAGRPQPAPGEVRQPRPADLERDPRRGPGPARPRAGAGARRSPRPSSTRSNAAGRSRGG